MARRGRPHRWPMMTNLSRGSFTECPVEEELHVRKAASAVGKRRNWKMSVRVFVKRDGTRVLHVWRVR
jgi:hypothetical protein